MSNEEIDVYSLLQNSTQDEVQNDTVHILSNLNLEEFMNVSEEKTLILEGENTDTLQLNKNDGWVQTNGQQNSDYMVLNNTQDAQIELLIKGIEVELC